MNAKLTDTQIAILEAAAGRPDGNIEPLPPTLRGGARAKVIAGMLARELITTFQDADHVEYYLTDTGYAAIGRKRKLPAPVVPDPELEAAVAAAEATWQRDAVTNHDAADGVQNLAPILRAIRPGTKLAEIVAAMRRPGGATIAEMMGRTGWQAHTVRGTLSGTLRKKLRLAIISEKGADGERAYRIV
ncbi:MAG: DUF3489 domain-containing protein [Aromatoleum sp.]|jgi:hypothetical protein|uniref:DUF3489 domain-containing protein n=1 Tax=Aromatoleum sp. TaxID=2307007 RepID=UPI00289400FE|nr:DUF3489 domain-containing protein [Aromatoleum sp.]MDT3669647.1 DUF3489 domain-containing protein [Aromatoleum sp.]